MVILNIQGSGKITLKKKKPTRMQVKVNYLKLMKREIVVEIGLRRLMATTKGLKLRNR